MSYQRRLNRRIKSYIKSYTPKTYKLNRPIKGVCNQSSLTLPDIQNIWTGILGIQLSVLALQCEYCEFVTYLSTNP